MIKSKKQMFIIIGVFALVMLLGTVTYAFFNYTRTGSNNTIRVGRISFISRQTETINLTNLFPIDPTNNEDMNDGAKVGTIEIEIEGDTDYRDGVEYLISTANTHIYTTEGKTVPISLSIETEDLGDESNTYFTSRNSKNANIYKILTPNEVVGEQQLLVGYIKPNSISGTAEGVNGSITIKAYLDKNKIAITDTYDGTESDNMETTNEWVDDRTVITTEEWNALQNTGISFQVKVEANEGIWVGEPFYDVMKRSTVMDNINSTYVNNATPGIDFTKISSDTNGKGIYTLSSTENEPFPIMYYRGDVDNNVLFGNFCWKIVRTTDTGGIKLIYNGNPVNNQCGNDRIIEKNQIINLSINSVGEMTIGDSYEYDSTNKVFVLENSTSMTVNAENINSLIGKYMCNSYQFSSKCSSLIKVDSYNSSTEQVAVKQITQDSSIMLDDSDPNKDNVYYNYNSYSPASVGYMYGTDYDVINGIPIPDRTQSYFGASFTYENGKYKLVDPVKMTPLSILNTHHYTCGLADLNGTCESIRYYIAAYPGGGMKYITLSNGKSVEDALNEMYVNTHDSLAKVMIDTWYSGNMTNYTSEIEDTVYCNNRYITLLGGWNSTDGDVSKDGHILSYGGSSLKCHQKNDSFTLSSAKGNGKLDYPVGMITDYEMKIAGAIYGTANPNTNFYLYDGNGFWTMSPYPFSDQTSYVGRVYAGGNGGGTFVNHGGYMSGFRPVISLKEGTSVLSGTGTPINPYIVE